MDGPVEEAAEAETDAEVAAVGPAGPFSGAPGGDRVPLGAGQGAAQPLPLGGSGDLADEYAALLSSVERVLDGVERALEALVAGTYGRCEACGEPIGTAAMEADPLTSRCARHAGTDAEPRPPGWRPDAAGDVRPGGGTPPIPVPGVD